MWHSLSFGNGSDAFAPTHRLQETFFNAFRTAGRPHGMAMFSRNDSSKNDVEIFFSPDASVFAKTIPGCRPCHRPQTARLALLVGHVRCWDLLFFPSA